MNLLIASILLAACAMPAAGDTAAAAETGAFELRAGAGYRYDSNVGIDEIDESTSQADSALLLDIGLGLNLALTQRLELRLDYDYSLTAYEEFSDYNLGLHQGTGGLTWRGDAFDAGLDAGYFAARLGDDAFLDLSRASAGIGRLFGTWFYLRGAYSASRKDFADLPERDADNGEVRADAYYLLDGMRRYVSLGYAVSREDARADAFDYDAALASVAYSHQVALGSRPVDLKARLRVEQRDYAAVAEAIGAPRRDERWRGGLSADVPMSGPFRVTAEAEYVHNGSNLASADYDETLVSLSLRTEF